MIVDSQSNMVSSHTDNPPSYDFVAAQTSSSEQPLSMSDKGTRSSVQQQPSMPLVMAVHGHPAPVMHQPTVYHYQNPNTGEHIASLLPPDHPEMVCLQEGGHVNETKFGILGILAAVIWFPLGVGLCLLDRRVKCRRCGMIIEDRMCG